MRRRLVLALAVGKRQHAAKVHAAFSVVLWCGGGARERHLYRSVRLAELVGCLLRCGYRDAIDCMNDVAHVEHLGLGCHHAVVDDRDYHSFVRLIVRCVKRDADGFSNICRLGELDMQCAGFAARCVGGLALANGDGTERLARESFLCLGLPMSLSSPTKSSSSSSPPSSLKSRPTLPCSLQSPQPAPLPSRAYGPTALARVARRR